MKILTKILFFLILSAFASLAHAEGFRCECKDYEVLIDGMGQPNGMTVSGKKDETLAVFAASHISVVDDDMDDDKGVVYEASGNSTLTGHYLAIRLEIKDDERDTDEGPARAGTFLMNMDGNQVVRAMKCFHTP